MAIDQETWVPTEASWRQWVGGNMWRYASTPPERSAPTPIMVRKPGDDHFPLPRAARSAPPDDEQFPLSWADDEQFPLPWADDEQFLPPWPGQSVPPDDEQFPLFWPGQSAPMVREPGDDHFPLPRAVQSAQPDDEQFPLSWADDEQFPLPWADDEQFLPPWPGQSAPPGDEQFPPPSTLAQSSPPTRRRTRQWFRAGIAALLFSVANSAMLIPSAAANEIAVPGNDIAAVGALYVIVDSQRDNAEMEDGSQPGNPIASD